MIDATRGEFKAEPAHRRQRQDNFSSIISVLIFGSMIILLLGSVSRVLGGVAGAAILPALARLIPAPIGTIGFIIAAIAGFGAGLFLPTLFSSGGSSHKGGGFWMGGPGFGGGGFGGGGFGGGGDFGGGFSGGGGGFWRRRGIRRLVMRYSVKAETFFSEEERKRIENTTGDIEKRTIGEVVVMVVDSSDAISGSRGNRRRISRQFFRLDCERFVSPFLTLVLYTAEFPVLFPVGISL